jgi:hypothetical protein
LSEKPAERKPFGRRAIFWLLVAAAAVAGWWAGSLVKCHRPPQEGMPVESSAALVDPSTPGTAPTHEP